MGVDGITLSEVRGHGRQKGHTETYRGQEYKVDLLPKVKLEMIVPDARVRQVVEAITAPRDRERSATERSSSPPSTRPSGFATAKRERPSCNACGFRSPVSDHRQIRRHRA